MAVVVPKDILISDLDSASSRPPDRSCGVRRLQGIDGDLADLTIPASVTEGKKNSETLLLPNIVHPPLDEVTKENFDSPLYFKPTWISHMKTYQNHLFSVPWIQQNALEWMELLVDEEHPENSKLRCKWCSRFLSELSIEIRPSWKGQKVDRLSSEFGALRAGINAIRHNRNDWKNHAQSYWYVAVKDQLQRERAIRAMQTDADLTLEFDKVMKETFKPTANLFKFITRQPKLYKHSFRNMIKRKILAWRIFSIFV